MTQRVTALTIVLHSETMLQPTMGLIEERCKVGEKGNTDHFEVSKRIFISHMEAPASKDGLDPGEIRGIIQDEYVDILTQKTSEVLQQASDDQGSVQLSHYDHPIGQRCRRHSVVAGGCARNEPKR